MRAQVLIALLLTGCTTVVQVRGRYSTSLSSGDIQQIRRVAVIKPHFGQTLISLQTLRPDRVHVEVRKYDNSGWDGIGMYVNRRNRVWQIDEHSPGEATGERTVIVN